ncbi:hypothetical protein GLAREA_07923 [Glarea lozoyensis ATCC 20868]|uniref:Extracellular membrane protein CFEM domain-containing protein n=1 Tax=Glarea lozoyensis (strain ATCC 20868 / MF5171) TaxID=1116229 RepID=S3D6R3_GLAL2|nr:uncharacterized protein GLAREA_07923 [Glarea lozoyensis ATCC 20868]EPE32789.1 hypothetical protein GLAREA_07923 [Glarea lozoyensis ATCC 20868]
MRISTIIVSGVMAALSVRAQSTTESVASGTQSVSPVQATQAACLAACPATDTKCRDACIVDPVGVPNPAIACITNTCTQGNGTAAENLAFENCQKACRSSAATVTATTDARPGYTGGVVVPTSASGAVVSSSGSGSPSAAQTGTASRSGTSSGSVQTGTSATTGGAGPATTSGAPATTSSSAANAENVRFGMSAVGVAGVFAAIFAL